MTAYKYQVVQYSQPGGAYYACVIPALEIIHRLDIRRRSALPEEGIQRDATRKRINEVAEYALSVDAIFPTPIIVSADSRIIAIQEDRLFLPDGSDNVGHVLDGQHRILGLRAIDSGTLAEFDLLVVFVFDIDTYSQATVFATINGTQKQVSKSLMYDLFELDPGRSVEKSLHEIVKSLNDDETSPFYRRIKLLGTRRGETETLSQAAFIDQLRRHYKPGGVFAPYYEHEDDWVVRKIVANCFAALDRAMASIPNDFPPDFFYKTSGFGGVVQALGPLVTKGESEKDLTEEYFFGVMSRFLQEMPARPEGVGNAAMISVRKAILRANALASPSDQENENVGERQAAQSAGT